MRAEPRSSHRGSTPAEPAPRLGDVVDASIMLVRNAQQGALRLVEGISDDARDVVREARALHQAARREATRIRAAGRAIPRSARVASELLRLAAAYRLDAAVRPAREVLGGARAAETARERLHGMSAERLHALCVELRGGVLKLGQFASTRVDLLPPAYAKALARLQDQVPALPGEAIRTRIRQELGERAELLLDLEQQLNPCEIEAPLLGEVSNQAYPLDVPLRVQPDPPASHRRQQPAFFVDAQRPRVTADQLRRYADDVHWCVELAFPHVEPLPRRSL